MLKKRVLLRNGYMTEGDFLSLEFDFLMTLSLR